MWGAVKKIEPGLRAEGKSLFRNSAITTCVFAQINTKVSEDYLALEKDVGLTGLLSKALLFGAARRFANSGKR
ncbi:hypothetical protein MLD38_019138 [Melastoma candidum]|uniref:Uncharacterized protein n=1 Tax=Melastoma candidum TaxID=119954 RepID=A0ACB9R024_9MYRT|nr:hypothetical protein MLD38_019138 [Melastoma candidum]